MIRNEQCKITVIVFPLTTLSKVYHRKYSRSLKRRGITNRETRLKTSNVNIKELLKAFDFILNVMS